MRGFFALVLLPFFGNAQSIKTFVKTNSFPVLSIDPQNENYTDLEAFGKSVGDATVVMLGEQSHGDATTFEAKTRLIKYLHEQKGFNVLAFEGDFFALNHGWDSVPKTKAATDTFLRNNIYGLWTHCHTAQHLFYEYIPATFGTNSPLVVTGFDNQLTMPWSRAYAVRYIDSLAHDLCIPFIDHPSYAHAIDCIKGMVDMQIHQDSALYTKARAYLQQFKQELADTLSHAEFPMMVIDNLIAFAKQMQYDDNRAQEHVSHNVRDEQMARNLKWLYEYRYTGQKIIVWAANLHISKFFKPPVQTMGGYLALDSAFIKKVYVLGFTSQKGVSGLVKLRREKIEKPKKQSLENWIPINFSYAFIDFKPYNACSSNSKEPFAMRYIGHLMYAKDHWNTFFDGMFFIREMHPCEKAE
ncbi:MAG TPA: erythromycin esterase family protein [Flavobacteriales bacterium]|nr:erythromycin esterase family protein [Flavobacteriales bacterium]